MIPINNILSVVIQFGLPNLAQPVKVCHLIEENSPARVNQTTSDNISLNQDHNLTSHPSLD